MPAVTAAADTDAPDASAAGASGFLRFAASAVSQVASRVEKHIDRALDISEEETAAAKATAAKARTCSRRRRPADTGGADRANATLFGACGRGARWAGRTVPDDQPLAAVGSLFSSFLGSAATATSPTAAAAAPTEPPEDDLFTSLLGPNVKTVPANKASPGSRPTTPAAGATAARPGSPAAGTPPASPAKARGAPASAAASPSAATPTRKGRPAGAGGTPKAAAAAAAARRPAAAGTATATDDGGRAKVARKLDTPSAEAAPAPATPETAAAPTEQEAAPTAAAPPAEPEATEAVEPPPESVTAPVAELTDRAPSPPLPPEAPQLPAPDAAPNAVARAGADAAPVTHEPEAADAAAPDVDAAAAGLSESGPTVAELLERLAQRERQILALTEENASLTETATVYRNQLEQLEAARTAEDMNADQLAEEFSRRVQVTEKRLQALQKVCAPRRSAQCAVPLTPPRCLWAGKLASRPRRSTTIISSSSRRLRRPCASASCSLAVLLQDGGHKGFANIVPRRSPS